jgi:hypothetical protein
MTMQLLAGAALAALIAAGSAGAAGPAAAPRCVTDKLGAETCRYPDGTTTQRSIDKLGVATFRDRDGTVTREKAYGERDAGAAVEVRGKTVARCRGQALCRR